MLLNKPPPQWCVGRALHSQLLPRRVCLQRLVRAGLSCSGRRLEAFCEQHGVCSSHSRTNPAWLGNEVALSRDEDADEVADEDEDEHVAVDRVSGHQPGSMRWRDEYEGTTGVESTSQADTMGFILRRASAACRHGRSASSNFPETSLRLSSFQGGLETCQCPPTSWLGLS